MNMRTLFSAALLLAGCSAAQPAAEPSTSATPTPESAGHESPLSSTVTLEAALADPRRSAENRARDAARHPEETLEFFGFGPGMRVLELWPGRGWYTEILAPVVAQDGSFTAAITDPNTEGYRGKLATEYRAWLAENAERLGSVSTLILSPPEYTTLGDAAYDMVLTFRSTHNWLQDGVAEQVYRAAYAALVPGGVFGVVQHRAPEGADPAASAEKGYVPQAYVIDLATRVGFVLEDESEINANPADTKDYPDGVWTLPPSLRGPEATREQARAIGESDRMTLRFRKPAAP